MVSDQGRFMKFLLLFLTMALSLQSLSLYAQKGPEVPRAEGTRSCSEDIKWKSAESDKKNPHYWMKHEAIQGITFAIVAGPSAPVVIAVTMAAIGGTHLTQELIKKHRKKMLEIFVGAAAQGNKATQKLWTLALKKNPEALKGMTYEQFLASIHKGDISGEACSVRRIDEILNNYGLARKKDVIQVAIDANELEAETLGEKEKSDKEAVVDSETIDSKDEETDTAKKLRSTKKE